MGWSWVDDGIGDPNQPPPDLYNGALGPSGAANNAQMIMQLRQMLSQALQGSFGMQQGQSPQGIAFDPTAFANSYRQQQQFNGQQAMSAPPMAQGGVVGMQGQQFGGPPMAQGGVVGQQFGGPPMAQAGPGYAVGPMTPAAPPARHIPARHIPAQHMPEWAPPPAPPQSAPMAYGRGEGPPASAVARTGAYEQYAAQTPPDQSAYYGRGYTPPPYTPAPDRQLMPIDTGPMMQPAYPQALMGVDYIPYRQAMTFGDQQPHYFSDPGLVRVNKTVSPQ